MIPMAIHVRNILRCPYSTERDVSSKKLSPRLTAEDRAEIVRKYKLLRETNHPRPSREIADQTGYSETTISRTLAKAGIKPRQAHEA